MTCYFAESHGTHHRHLSEDLTVHISKCLRGVVAHKIDKPVRSFTLEFKHTNQKNNWFNKLSKTIPAQAPDQPQISRGKHSPAPTWHRPSGRPGRTLHSQLGQRTPRAHTGHPGRGLQPRVPAQGTGASRGRDTLKGCELTLTGCVRTRGRRVRVFSSILYLFLSRGPIIFVRKQ